MEKGLALALGAMGWKPKPAKVVVIVGDAPPHKEALPEAIDMAREAHQNPEIKKGKRSAFATGRRRKKTRTTPFFINCLAVGYQSSAVRKDTAHAFEQIAEAGGGIYSTLGNADQIVRQILMMAFGKDWEDQAGTFLSWYEDLQAKGAFKGLK